MQRLWLAWTDEADAEGLTDFYGLQRRAAREVFLAGEVFFRFRPRRAGDGLSVPVQMQMLPSEMLPLEQTGVSAAGNPIRQGIEFDRIGRRVAYHFFRRHPGDSTDPGLAGEIVLVPASDVIHVIDPVEGGQLRGVTEFGAGRFVSDTLMVDVRVSDLPDPRPGDLIVIGIDSFTIQGEPVRDRERLIWTLDLRQS